MARTKSPAIQGSIRLPAELWARADHHAAQLTARDPGMSYTRSDAIRIALEKCLPPLPEEAKASGAPVDGAKPAKPTKRAAKRKL